MKGKVRARAAEDNRVERGDQRSEHHTKYPPACHTDEILSTMHAARAFEGGRHDVERRDDRRVVNDLVRIPAEDEQRPDAEEGDQNKLHILGSFQPRLINVAKSGYGVIEAELQRCASTFAESIAINDVVGFEHEQNRERIEADAQPKIMLQNADVGKNVL